MNINLNEFVKNLYQYANINDLEIERGREMFMQHVKITKAKATYKFYESHLRLLCDYLKENNIEFFSKITTEIINSYVLRCQKLKITNCTINKRIGALKAVIAYLNKEEIINQDFKYYKLKEIKPEIEIISMNNLKLVLEDGNRNGTRQNYLLLLLLISTGIRRTELTMIDKEYINLESNQIYLEHTKTNSPRYIYFDSTTKKLIESEMKNNNSKWLFYNPETNDHITTSQIDNFISRIKKRLNLDKLSPHKFRHTYATMLLENGATLEEVRLLMGHSSYEMTKRYLHINNKKLAKTSLAMNPLTSLLHG